MADDIPNRRRHARKGRDLAGDRSQEAADHWNAKHPIGADVRYWRVLPTGPTLDTRTRSEAIVMPSGDPCVWIHGVRGAVSLFHLVPRAELAAEAPPFELGAEWDYRPIEEAHCCVCGCTEDEPCDGGCWWIDDDAMRDRCSQCEGKPLPKRPPMRLVRIDSPTERVRE